MGKNILVQRRGRRFFIFRAPTNRRIHPVGYHEASGRTEGWVRELLHEVARGAPLAQVNIDGGAEVYLPAPEGLSVGQRISIGSDAPAETGNITNIGKIPEGTMIFNVENKPGDGGTLAPSSGSFAPVVLHNPKSARVPQPVG